MFTIWLYATEQLKYEKKDTGKITTIQQMSSNRIKIPTIYTQHREI